MEISEGRCGNLTPEQESKLAEMWAVVLRRCGSHDTSQSGGPPANGGKKLTASSSESTSSSEKPRAGPAAVDLSNQAGTTTTDAGVMSPEETRAAFWSMVQAEHPDAMMLRFLRARKWDVEKAVAMLMSTLHWRTRVMHVGELLRGGEALALEQEGSSSEGDPKARKEGKEFMFQMRIGKCTVRGMDRSGRPVCTVRVRKHFSRDQSDEILKRWILYIIETSRLAFTPSCDTAVIVFDLTSFGLGNLDYVPVKFIIQCFEANYPEILGKVIIHKAPWFFPSIWKLVSSWIGDPVIISKIFFTANAKELDQHIDQKKWPKELGGEDPWEYRYIEPVPASDDAKLRDTAGRDQLLAAREALAREFEEATRQWIKNPKGESAAKKRRNDLAVQINQENYWQLDPYIRARSLWDRLGNFTKPGVNFFPEQVSNGNGSA